MTFRYFRYKKREHALLDDLGPRVRVNISGTTRVSLIKHNTLDIF